MKTTQRLIVIAIAVTALTIGASASLWAASTDSATSSISDIASQASSLAKTLNINTATTEQLSSIPGLSSLASAITSYRDANGTFSSLKDLLNIDGIDASLLEKITPFLSL